MNTHTATDTATFLAHTVHARDSRLDTRCPLCRTYGPVRVTEAQAACEHEGTHAHRLPGDTVASTWECDECGHLRPFTDADYAFAGSQPWRAPAPAGIAPLNWMLMGDDFRLAVLKARA